VGFDDVPADCQTEPGSACSPVPGRFHPVEPFEQLVQFALRDPGCRVSDVDRNQAVAAGQANGEIPPRVHVFQLVIEEVGEELAEPFGIAEHRRLCVPRDVNGERNVLSGKLRAI